MLISSKMNVPVAAACVALFFATSSVYADVAIYATSREGSQLVKVNLTTNTVITLKTTPNAFPDSMTTDVQGRIIYDLADLSQVRMYDPILNTDVLLADSTNGINGPQDIEIEPNGNYVIVSNYLGGTLTRTMMGAPPNATLLSSLPGDGHPQGLAFDPAGHLFVLIGTNTATCRLVQMDPMTGVILNSSTNFDPTNSLDGLAYDSFTNLLYATSKVGNVIYSIDPSTLSASLVPGSTIPTPDGLFSDNNGLLYVASRGDSHVYSFNLTTKTALQLTLVPGIDDLGGLALAPPTMLKQFGAANLIIGPPNTVSLTFTITNPNTVPLKGIGFTDMFPAGLVVASPNGLNPSTGCNGTLPTAVPMSTSIAITGAILAANGSCTFSVNLTSPVGSVAGLVSNCVTASAPASGPGNQSCATITLALGPCSMGCSPPQIVKTFGAAMIPLSSNATLTFVITNPNAADPLVGISMNDMLPSGLFVATPNGLNPTTGCNGTVPTAVAGTPTVTLSGASLQANGSCTFAINVVGVAVGLQNNSVTVSDSTAGTGNTSTAQITVVGPPVITKEFGASPIQVNGSTSLSFVIENPNVTTALNGIAFSDPLPAGLIIATPNGLDPLTGCNGTVPVAVAGTNLISLTGASLPLGQSCTFTINVTATANGSQFNKTSNVTALDPNSDPLTGGPAMATLLVEPPSLDPYQIRYAANLDKGDSYISFTNAGTLKGTDPAGRICVNVYTFDPAEEMISCCACLVTPNGVNSLSAQRDLISNTLTPGSPTSIVIKLIASTPNAGTCNASTPNPINLVRGMRAWGSTLHALSTIPQTYGSTETPFSSVELSASELLKLSQFCGFIQSIGSGFGICRSCQSGALGGTTR